MNEYEIMSMVEKFVAHMNLAWYMESAKRNFDDELIAMREQLTRPVVMFKPQLGIDGNQYFFLYGTNIMEGCAGFGDTPELAALDFEKNWRESKLYTPPTSNEIMAGFDKAIDAIKAA